MFVIDRIYVAAMSRDSNNQKELQVKAGDVIEVFTWRNCCSWFLLLAIYHSTSGLVDWLVKDGNRLGGSRGDWQWQLNQIRMAAEYVPMNQGLNQGQGQGQGHCKPLHLSFIPPITLSFSHSSLLFTSASINLDGMGGYRGVTGVTSHPPLWEQKN